LPNSGWPGLPRPTEDRDPNDTHQVEAQDDEHDAADLTEQGQVVAQRPCGYVRCQAKQREDPAEAKYEGNGVGKYAPSRCRQGDGWAGDGRDGRRGGRDRAYGSDLTEISRHDRQDAWRDE